MTKKISVWCVLSFFLFLTGCANKARISSNAVYYWKDTVYLDKDESAFIKKNNISAVYLHLYDLVSDSTGKNVPRNETVIVDKFPEDVEIIPLIFLSPGTITDTTDTRIMANIVYNGAITRLTKVGYDAPRELQINYNWGPEVQDKYFEFLENLAELMHRQKDGQLSATIRLQHLDMGLPPVDYVAMALYDTESASPTEEHGLLNTNVVRERLQSIKRYELPVLTMLPLYGFNMVYTNGQLRCISRGVNLMDTTCFERIDKNHYRSLVYQHVPLIYNTHLEKEGRIYPGDIIYHNEPSMEKLDTVVSMISRVRVGDFGNVGIYQLDHRYIHRFTPEQIQTLFHGGSMHTKNIWD